MLLVTIAAPMATEAATTDQASANRARKLHKPQKADFRSPQIGEDGSVTFAFSAPDAKRVAIVGRFGKEFEIVPMEKDNRGVWRTILKNLKPDLYNYAFSVDGSAGLADPLNSAAFVRNTENTVWSLLELAPPEGNAFWQWQDVAHGTVHCSRYHATTLEQMREVYVYTPPRYQENRDRRYPVLYLFHGGGDHADGFLTAGRVDIILDNLIAGGKAQEMIVVMPKANGVTPFQPLPSGGVDRSTNFAEFERSFFEDVLPFVEKCYRISPQREHHAVAGFSVGAALARTVGLKHLDRFAWVGQFSGGTRRAEDYEETFTPLLADANKTNDLLKLYWVSGPTGKNNLPEFHRRMTDAGMEYISRPDRFGHSYRTCRHILAFDFLPRLFRESE